jgi:hypothetical protein
MKMRARKRKASKGIDRVSQIRKILLEMEMTAGLDAEGGICVCRAGVRNLEAQQDEAPDLTQMSQDTFQEVGLVSRS